MFLFLVIVVMSAVSGLQGEVPGFGTSGYLFFLLRHCGSFDY